MDIDFDTPRPGDTMLDVHYANLKNWRDNLADRYMSPQENAALDQALLLLDITRYAVRDNPFT